MNRQFFVLTRRTGLLEVKISPRVITGWTLEAGPFASYGYAAMARSQIERSQDGDLLGDCMDEDTTWNRHRTYPA